jgi:hypothetical protein
MAVSVTQIMHIQRWIIWLVNNKLARMWMEAVMARFETFPEFALKNWYKILIRDCYRSRRDLNPVPPNAELLSAPTGVLRSVFIYCSIEYVAHCLTQIASTMMQVNTITRLVSRAELHLDMRYATFAGNVCVVFGGITFQISVFTSLSGGFN